MEAFRKKDLFYSSIAFSSLLLLWPIFVVISVPRGTIPEQIQSVNESFVLHGLNFLVALFIAPSLLWMLRSLYPLMTGNISKRWLSMAVFFYLLYFLLIEISYGSQVFYLPWILDMYPQPVVLKWFFYNPDSIAYLFNQSGYLSWSLATFFLFFPLIGKQRKLLLIASLIFLLSAVLQTLASLGVFLNIENLASLSFFSGILLFPAGILLMIFSTKK